MVSLPVFYPYRFASLAITVFGAITNFILAVQVLAAWRSLKWEPESEWEASSDRWQVDGVKVIWVLLSSYFAASATVGIVGFLGIVKSKSSLVRFYRDYSVADFSFCTFVTAITTYAVFHTTARAAVCEELSHHPELMRDMAEMGLNLENCEPWLERAVLVFVPLMVVIIVIRLHFLLAVTNLYSRLIRDQWATNHPRSHVHFRHNDSDAPWRIYLLPFNQPQDNGSVELVYTPVPIGSLPENVRSSAKEAWVTQGSPRTERGRHSRSSSDASHPYFSGDQEQQRLHRHHRHHSHSHGRNCQHQSSRSTSSTRTGKIRLPVTPDEGLLAYSTKA